VTREYQSGSGAAVSETTARQYQSGSGAAVIETVSSGGAASPVAANATYYQMIAQQRIGY